MKMALDDEAKHHEGATQELRQKHVQQIEAVNEQVQMNGKIVVAS